MTPTIVLNGAEYPAFRWTEAVSKPGEIADVRHARSEALLHEGVGELRPGEVYFESDQTFAFDSTFSLKGDGRKFVIIASQGGRHVVFVPPAP